MSFSRARVQTSYFQPVCSKRSADLLREFRIQWLKNSRFCGSVSRVTLSSNELAVLLPLLALRLSSRNRAGDPGRVGQEPEVTSQEDHIEGQWAMRRKALRITGLVADLEIFMRKATNWGERIFSTENWCKRSQVQFSALSGKGISSNRDGKPFSFRT